MQGEDGAWHGITRSTPEVNKPGRLALCGSSSNPAGAIKKRSRSMCAGLMAKTFLPLTGQRWELGHLEGFLPASASFHSPVLFSVVLERLRRYHPDELHAYATVWKRLWRILSSVCVTSFWIQRKWVAFHQAEVTAHGCVEAFWKTGMRQLQAVAKREYRRADTKIQERICYYVNDI